MLSLVLILILFLVLYSFYKIFSKGKSSDCTESSSSTSEPIKERSAFSFPDDLSSSFAQSSSTIPSPYASSDEAVLKGTYDIFLSFRGEDTRKGFVSHLYRALLDKGIHTFRDDERLTRGNCIAQEILRAIDESKIAIIVFSKNYANSSWCLDELVKIMESKPQNIVVPVFYDVSPSDIRHQRNEVAEALAKLGTIDHGRMQRWKEALTKASNLSGWHVPETANGDESECIRRIIAYVHRELNHRIPSTWEDLVGMEWRVNKVIEKLRVGECNNVFMVGIWGMGGSGKTRTASATFDKLSLSFEDGSCFLEIPIGECSENGLKDLQKTLLSKILKLKSDEIYIRDTKQGINMMKERLQFKKILIVLDNVGDREQLKALAADRKLFGPGSRVIITTRDIQLLNGVDDKYEVDLLENYEAMQLFNYHAFQKNEPCEDFAELSHKVVKYAKGLPLALKVLGSHLQGLSIEEWSSQISGLQNIPHDKIQSVLKISYDGLDEIDKNIFLDVACFFRGWKVTWVIRILDSIESYHKRGITPLQRKSLLSVDRENCIEMHDLVQEMGRTTLRKDHPGSWLWEREEVLDVLSGKEEDKDVEAVVFQTSSLNEEKSSLNGILIVSNEALKRMKRIRLLSLRQDWSGHLDCGLPPESLSNELQWLEWHGYPWHSLPPRFEGRKLSVLTMQHSNMIEPFARGQNFKKLRLLNLSYSKGMTQTPDFSQIPCLEELHLKCCWKLVEIHSSFGHHQKLQSADLSGCNKLKILPERLRMRSLKHLNLCVCKKLKTFPEIEGNMTALQELLLSGTGIKRLPDSITNLSGLCKLELGGCKSLGTADNSGDNSVDHKFVTIVKAVLIDNRSFRRTLFTLPLSFPQLVFLSLWGCNLANLAIPENCLPSLQQLDLASNRMKELLMSEDCLSSLRMLDLRKNWLTKYSTERLVWQDLPNFDQGGGFPMVSLIHVERQETSYFDWGALIPILHKRDSKLTIQLDGTEIMEWFEYRICGLNCEVMLPPLSTSWCNKSLRGLAIILHTVSSRYFLAELSFRRSVVLIKEEEYLTESNEILFHYIPINSQWMKQCSSNSQATHETPTQICLFDACITSNCFIPTDAIEWGVRLVYEDEAYEIKYNSISDGKSDLSDKYTGRAYLKVMFSCEENALL